MPHRVTHYTRISNFAEVLQGVREGAQRNAERVGAQALQFSAARLLSQEAALHVSSILHREARPMKAGSQCSPLDFDSLKWQYLAAYAEAMAAAVSEERERLGDEVEREHDDES